jgi:hypothetical protein
VQKKRLGSKGKTEQISPIHPLGEARGVHLSALAIQVRQHVDSNNHPCPSYSDHIRRNFDLRPSATGQRLTPDSCVNGLIISIAMAK